MHQLISTYMTYTHALALVAIVGLLVGSFLNVVIARLPTGLSVVRPRSRCPQCETMIPWYDNIPVLSYLLLRGRCRSCRTSIAVRYPLVEVMTSLLWVTLALRFGPTPSLILWLGLGSVLVAIVFIDLDHYWIPDVIVLPAMLWTFAWSLAPGALGFHAALLGLTPAAGLWLFGALWLLLFRREGMGLGDIKLLALIGLGVGWLDALGVIFLAAAQGSVIGIVVALRGGHKTPEPVEHDDGWTPSARSVPFGPFLVIATLEVVLLPHIFADVMPRLSHLFAGWLA